MAPMMGNIRQDIYLQVIRYLHAPPTGRYTNNQAKFMQKEADISPISKLNK